MGTITTFPTAPLGYTPTNTLAYAQAITTQSGISTTTIDATGLSVSVVVAEGRRIRISAFGLFQKRTALGFSRMYIYEGATTLTESIVTAGIDEYITMQPSVVLTPSAGVHTYKVMVDTQNGTLDLVEAAGYPAYILVEDITGQPSAVPPASVPVGQIGYSVYGTSITGLGDLAIVPGISLNLVVPAGRVIKFSFHGQAHTTAAAGWITQLRQDTVTVGRLHTLTTDASEYQMVDGSVVISPSAGAHTYDVQVDQFSGTGTFEFDGSGAVPLYLLAEDITPTPAPANSAPSSTLAYAELATTTAAFSAETEIARVTFTVPAGRRLKITGHAEFNSAVATGDGIAGDIRISAVGGTGIGQATELSNTAQQKSMLVETVWAPAAGTYTLLFTMRRYAGTATITALTASNTPAFILVEDITGAAVSTYGFQSIPAQAIASEAWTDYVPTLTNMTLGNGTVLARYLKLGRLVFVKFSFVLGTTSAMGTGPRFSLPVAASAVAYPDYHILGTAQMTDVSTNLWMGFIQFHQATGTALLRVTLASGTYVGFADISATVPFTWVSTYSINTQFFYEAAS